MDKTKYKEIVEMLCEIYKNEILLNHEDFGYIPEDLTYGSPIEQIMEVYLVGISHLRRLLYDVDFIGGGFCSVDECISYVEKHGLGDNDLHVFQQVPIGNYQVDFLFVMIANSGGVRRTEILVVECDGHDFHERTKEQAAKDKFRDRFMLSNGLPTMRFTGSEIWRDVHSCVEEIRQYFYSRWNELYNSQKAMKA